MPVCKEFGCDIEFVLWSMPIQQVFKKLFYLQRLHSKTPLNSRIDDKVGKKLLTELQTKAGAGSKDAK